jgi:hypothetical protein
MTNTSCSGQYVFRRFRRSFIIEVEPARWPKARWPKARWLKAEVAGGEGGRGPRWAKGEVTGGEMAGGPRGGQGRGGRERGGQGRGAKASLAVPDIYPGKGRGTLDLSYPFASHTTLISVLA